MDASNWQPDSACAGLTFGLSTLADVFAFAQRIHARIIWGLNLKANDPATAADEANAVLLAGGDQLLGLEMGNEPNDWTTEPAYEQMWEAYASAITASGAVAPLVGPSMFDGEGHNWFARYVQKERTRLSLVTYHYYPLQQGASAGSSQQPTIANLLSPTLMGRELMNKLRALHGSQLASAMQSLWTSLTLKDLQIYLSDPQAEALVAQLGFDGAVPHGPGDAVTVVDANITANKASALTTITYTDAVTLDAQGTATHHLTITYHFDSATTPSLIHFLYHRDYYLTYLRVYAPQNAHLLSYTGFNGGETQINHSDLPWRQMWGGLVDLPDGQLYTLHFVWSVPHAATRDAQGHWQYALDFQHQSGSNQRLELTITPPGAKQPSVTYNGALDKDRAFSVTY